MGDAPVRRPKLAHDLQALFENPLIILERDGERLVLAPVIAAARGEVDAPTGEHIEGGPLLRHADRMVQWQHGDSWCEPDAPGACGDMGQDELWAGQHAERVEMVLADPNRVHAELLGVQRLVDNLLHKLVRGTRITVVVIVAEREIAELHGPSQRRSVCCSAMIDVKASIANTPIKALRSA